MKLTKLVVDRSKYEGSNGSRDVRWDDEVRGFGLRIYPSGRKSFVLSYRHFGRKRLICLGQYGAITLDEAKRLVRVKLGQIALGKDPLLERKNVYAMKSLKDLCNDYLEKYSLIHKKSSREDKRRINAHILPLLGKMPVEGVTDADITRLHLEIGKRTIYEANRTVELVRAIYEKGREWKYVSQHFINPAKGVKKFREKTRDRFVTHEELPKLAAAINEERNIYVKAAIWLYLTTGVRKSELLKAKWSDVNQFRQELKLNDTKSGNTHYVPLSSVAMGILRGLPRVEGNLYLIPGHIKGRPLVNISKPWGRIRTRAGVQDIRLHDLRRTVGSWLAQKGNSLHLIGRVLNHRSSATTAIYARFGLDSVRDALEAHGNELIQISSGQQEKKTEGSA